MSNYTLHLGDCLEYMRGMDAGSVDLIFTDPPYGHSNNANGDLAQVWERALGQSKDAGEARPIANDGAEANEIFAQTLPEYGRILKPGSCCCCCCCGGGGPDPQFARWSMWIDQEPSLKFKQMVVWDKGPMGMGWHYRRSYETVLVSQRKGAACKWFDTTNKIENIIRPGSYGIRKIIPQADEHPTQKPVELAAMFILLHTQPGDTVFDPFMGSGTTGVACMQLGRNFIGCEIDPRYHAIAERRISQAAAQIILPFAEPEPALALSQASL